ncbi:MAG: transcription-repair coupling factor [Actinomycetota bacterium]
MLRSLPARLAGDPTLRTALARRDATVAVPEAARALVAAAAASTRSGGPLVIVVPRADEGQRLAADIEAFLGPGRVEFFPAWETLPFERVSPGVETMGTRARVLHRLAEGPPPDVVVVPVRSLLQRLPDDLATLAPRAIAPGDQIDIDELVEQLVRWGYRREYQVEHRGEVAVRGSIVDVFPATADEPVRVDLWGDEVERLTTFTVADQRSVTDLRRVVLRPARELLITNDIAARAKSLVASEPWGREQWDRLADAQLFDGMESWLPWLATEERVVTDLLGDGAAVWLLEPRRLRDRADDLLAEEADLARSLAVTWGVGTDDDDERTLPRLHLPIDRALGNEAPAQWRVVSIADGPDTPTIAATPWEPVAGDSGRLLDQLRRTVADDGVLVVAADGAGTADRIQESLGAEGIPLERVSVAAELPADARGGYLTVAPLDRGAVLPDTGIAVLAEADLTGRRSTHRRARPRRRGAQRVFEDLHPGDHVVHHTHGVARYAGMVTRAIMGTERDYLLLEFRGDDRIYLPSDQVDLIRPYTGGDTPSLSRMGGSDWAKAKAKVRSAVREVAQELVVLYQKRATSEGLAHDPDSPWQRELEDAFPFQETPDQLAAIEATKTDMESGVPMDRLVCGDVGFGKTEVAIRAVFKAIQSGTQAAVLVPTTLLAQQHFQTFADRFAPYPVRVEVLSRFLTPAQQREVVTGLATGDVDVVIGTHRLLGADVEFHRLGLLVVDEEQRFGVTHKERIKQFKADVDVLTLTATPIPRTLEMSLTGIRDLTLLQTPPAERQPILTYVGEYDDRAVAEAIRRELLREGQVFFVHNRVADIDQVAADLVELVPEARVAVAHGQMDEGTLEQVVVDFWEGKFDVLVCTTIIESGIDMPTVNTLVVDRADLLGLGQLHQLRGRVGRAGSRAYAYLFHPVDVSLSEEAYERLKTIGEATELGSGFRIAMRDLEIRGAGHLLGEAQSGHIAAVGYDLYVEMVSEAVAELKGEERREPAEVKIDLPVVAYLPDAYVGREELRLEAYRKLAGVTELSDVDAIRAGWEDRFGPVPDEAEELLRIARLRAAGHRLALREIGMTRGSSVRVAPVLLKASQEIRLQRLVKGAVYKEGAAELQLPVPRGTDALTHVLDVLDSLFPVEEAVPA